MFFHRFNLFVASVAALAMSGCASAPPLSSVDRTKYKTVTVNPGLKVPKHYVYRDLTGQRARGVGSNFGLIGALIGGAIGADSEGKGFKRFEATAGKIKIDIANVVRTRFVTTLRTSKMFQVAGNNADADFQLEVVAYGVAPVSGHQLGGAIAAKVKLIGRDGRTIWSRTSFATSRTTAMLEDYEKNPRLWPLVINEAAEQLARQFILYTKEESH